MLNNERWNLEMSELARKTENPIRSIWEGCKSIPNPSKKLITLQIGKNYTIYQCDLINMLFLFY